MNRLFLLLLAGCAAPAAALAQTPGSVGIGTTSPDTKAALDIQATGKGLLIPRMDSASRAAISTPPDGLMVFQTDGRRGFWYAVGGQWLYIPDKAKAGDNLGNHTATQPIRYSTNDADKLWLVRDGGANGSKLAHSGGWSLDYYAGPNNGTANQGQHRFFTAISGGWQERLRLSADGNLGLGATNPATRLSITPTVTETKITLWDGGSTTNHYGFGISGGQLNYHVDATSASHVFYATGKNGNGTELLRIRGNGRVGIGTDDPQQLLDVDGTVRAQTGFVTPPAAAYTYSTARTYYHMLGAQDFTSADPNAYEPLSIASSNTPPVYYSVLVQGAGAATLLAPVHLPQGAVVTNLRLLGYHNDPATGPMTARLVGMLSQPNSGGIGNSTSATASITANNASVLQGADATASITIDNSQYVYFVQVDLARTYGGHQLVNVRLTYTVTQVE